LIETRFARGIAGFINILAETLVREGRLDEASDAIAEAMRYEAQQGVRLRRPELMRIEAKILQRAGSPARAEKLFSSALDEAHAMNALSYELRIATDLATLYLETGRSDDATGLLLPIYRRFSEGFATRDLRAADATLRRARSSLTTS
jgi:predicted ATPase